MIWSSIRPCSGRPSQLLELDRSHHRFAAIQIGVKSTRIALLPAAIADTDKWDLQIPTPSTAISWAAAVAQAWRELAGDDVELILLSVPGVVDETEGRVLLSPNLRWSQYIALRELLQMAELPATDQSVVIVQEIRALALGHMAVDPSSHDFLLVDFGNGVGAAAVVGGELYHGALALSGELGHTPVLGQHARVRVRIGPDALKRWCRGTVFSPLSRPFTNRSRPGSSCSITLQLWASSRGWGMRSTPSRSRSPVH